MKAFSVLFLVCAIAASGFLNAAPVKTRCNCIDCSCTPESHCGCYSEAGCKCAASGSPCRGNCTDADCGSSKDHPPHQ